MKERIEKRPMESASWLSAAFQQHSRLPSGGDLLEEYRQRQFAQFIKRGFPTRREEFFKYTDLSFLEKSGFHLPAPHNEALIAKGGLKDLLLSRARDNILLVFINGHFAPQLSALSQLPEGVVLGSLRQSLQTHTALMSPYLLREIDVVRHPLACLNAALFSDGMFLYLPRSVTLEKPLHVLSLSLDGENFMSHLRHLLILESDTRLCFTEEYLGEGADDYLTNAYLDLFVGRDARLDYYKVQNEASKAKHFASVFFHQKQGSFVNAFSFATGGQFSRSDLTVALQEQQAACRVNGFYGLAADGQVIDHHLYIDHAAPSTQSEMAFHGVLARQSRGIFNGRVVVRPEAKKTQARQLNHNLLLSAAAEINAKPDLEIYTDEMQCQHGATVGQLDEDTLFYLGTRGIDRRTATTILLQAFIETVLSEVRLPWLVQYMHEQWENRLASLD